MRIIACMGVFNGHFLGLTLQSQTSLQFLTWLRIGWVSRTPLCVLFQGDTNVVLFFVVAGFLHAYSVSDYAWRSNVVRLCRRYTELIIPSIIVTILCGISFKIQEIFQVSGIEFTIKDFVDDISTLSVSGGYPIIHINYGI